MPSLTLLCRSHMSVAWCMLAGSRQPAAAAAAARDLEARVFEAAVSFGAGVWGKRVSSVWAISFWDRQEFFLDRRFGDRRLWTEFFCGLSVTQSVLEAVTRAKPEAFCMCDRMESHTYVYRYTGIHMHSVHAICTWSGDASQTGGVLHVWPNGVPHICIQIYGNTYALICIGLYICIYICAYIYIERERRTAI